MSEPNPWESAFFRHYMADMAPDVPHWGVPVDPPLGEPSRVAFAGCWHSHTDEAIAGLRAAKDTGADVVVHTGDFLYTGATANAFCMAVQDEATRLNMHLVVVRGNHDNPEIFAKAARTSRRRKPADGFARITHRILHAPNGTRWTWRGVEFVALGGAASVDRPARVEGQSWWPGEVATTRDVNKVLKGGPATVLVTHDLPLGSDFPYEPTPDWWDMDYAYAHHNLITTAMDGVEPDWVICGHMHARHSGHTTTKSGKRVNVEVLDQGRDGPTTNLMVADLADGALTPVR